MAYNALNNLIDAYIYANGVQAITGQILNGVLKQMVSQLGSGYHLMGVAGPETTPASNDFAMAYFAATAGEYTGFGGITLAAGEVAVLLTYGNGSWAKQTIYNVPTGTADLENTADFITNAVTDLVNYYTKTEVDDTLANYPTLEDLATALADYYTKTEIDTTLADYATKDGVDETLADYYDKDEVDAEMGDRYTKSEVDTKLADYYRKAETYDKDEVDSIVATLSRQEYIVAWDGTTAPDVSAIPAGVTVTYSGTPYTGTLAASASTVNKIYMVWNGTAYDMYGTSQDGGYSWVPMGTTSVDLSQYATKAELSQLEHKVTDLIAEGKIEPVIVENEYVDKDNGTDLAYNGWNRTDFVNIANAKKLKIYQSIPGNFNCWYDINKAYISNFILNRYTTELEVPDNAVYFKVSNQASAMASATYEISEYRTFAITALTAEVRGISERLQLTCTKFKNRSSIDSDGNIVAGTNFYRTYPIPVFGAEKILNISTTPDGIYFYSSAEASQDTYLGRHDDGIVPTGALYFILTFYLSGGIAPGNITYEVAKGEDPEESIEEIKQALSGKYTFPKAQIVQKSSIVDGDIVSAGSKFYRTAPFYIGYLKEIWSDNPKIMDFYFYSSNSIVAAKFLGTYYGNNNTVPNGAMYCVACFYDSANDSAGTAIPANTVVYLNEPDNKTCIFIGDSISTGNNYRWKGMLEDSYGLKYVRNATDGTNHESETTDADLWPADGGIPVIPPATESTYNYLKSIWYRCAEGRMGIYKFDAISLFGGTNDLAETMELGTYQDEPYLDTTETRPATLTFAAALKGCIEMLRRDFPTKPIFLCTVFQCLERGNEVDAQGITLSERMAMLQMQIADYYRRNNYWEVTAVPFYWDMRTAVTCKQYVFSRDGVHPNYSWAKRMSTIFAETVPLKVQKNGLSGISVI